MTIDKGPGVEPLSKGLIFPNQEGIMVDHSWLDHFLALEDSPCHCIHIVLHYIENLISSLINGLVGYHRELVKETYQRLQELFGNEKFIVCLLIYIAIFRSPAIFGVS